MDKESINILNNLTSEFYLSCSDSFSATREHPWHGWDLCLASLKNLLHQEQLSVLDLACGNLRFISFLQKHTSAKLDAYAVDSCPQLLSNEVNAHFSDVDIIQELQNQTLTTALSHIPTCDITCSFGFFHHIPGNMHRFACMDTLLAKTKQDGFVLISLWQFSHSLKLLNKAEHATAQALALYPNLQLEPGDYLLNWQDDEHVFRYCHDFSDDEINDLIQHVTDKAKLVSRFNADGKDDNLNCYLVFQKL